MRIKGRQNGIGAVVILITVSILFLVVLIGWVVIVNKSDRTTGQNNAAAEPEKSTNEVTSTEENKRLVRWDVDGSGTWQPLDKNPPACPVQPMMQPPSKLDYVSTIHYPGQVRSGSYKTVGTLRFAGTANDAVSITAPMAASIFRGARYTVNDETQYSFDFINSCGVMYRLGHLQKLTSIFDSLARSFPESAENDLKMTRVPEGITVEAGEKIATSVGSAKSGETFFDFGVYDLRNPNQLSKNAGYIQAYGKELAGYGVCWFDWLPTTDAALVYDAATSQPHTAKKNDYCVVR